MGGVGRTTAALGEGVVRSAALAVVSIIPGSGVDEERLARSDWERLVRAGRRSGGGLEDRRVPAVRQVGGGAVPAASC
eukprot:1540126-Pleurochrysis_carterae.AAC.4